MRTTIAILLITSVVSVLSVESSPRRSRGGAPRDEPEEADLSHIEGLEIPPGIEIRHKGQILAKVYNRDVRPYLFQGNFAVLQETLSTERPYHTTFRHRTVTHKKWLQYISAYAYETNERWICVSAINTIQHYEQVDHQIERQRQAHFVEQQRNIHHIHEAALRHQDIHGYSHLSQLDFGTESSSSSSAGSSAASSPTSLYRHLITPRIDRHEAMHHGYSQDSHYGSSQGHIYGSQHGDSDEHLSQLNFGTESSSSSAGSSAASSPTSSYRHIVTPRIERHEAIHYGYSPDSHYGSSQSLTYGSHHRTSDVHLSQLNFDTGSSSSSTGSSAASSPTSLYRHLITPRIDRHEAIYHGYSQDSHYGSSQGHMYGSHHGDSDDSLSQLNFGTESSSSSSAGSSVPSSPTSSHRYAVTPRMNPR